MTGTLKVVIAEPSSIIRTGLISMLKRHKGVHIEVFEVDDMDQLRDALVWHKPDILIINPVAAGTLGVQHIKKSAAKENMKFVAMQTTLADNYSLRAYDEVISVFDTEEQIAEKLLRLAAKPAADKKHESLSAREKEVIVCVIKGMTNKQIADKLYLSTHTVITHRRNISNKLQIHSTAGLTIYAIVNKLVDLEDVKDSAPAED